MTERDWEKDWQMCENATSAPWIADGTQIWHIGKGYDDSHDPHVCIGSANDDVAEFPANIRLMAESRQALPYWLQRVQKAEDLLRRAEPLLLCWSEDTCCLLCEDIPCPQKELWDEIKAFLGKADGDSK